MECRLLLILAVAAGLTGCGAASAPSRGPDKAVARVQDDAGEVERTTPSAADEPSVDPIAIDEPADDPSPQPNAQPWAQPADSSEDTAGTLDTGDQDASGDRPAMPATEPLRVEQPATPPTPAADFPPMPLKSPATPSDGGPPERDGSTESEPDAAPPHDTRSLPSAPPTESGRPHTVRPPKKFGYAFTPATPGSSAGQSPGRSGVATPRATVDKGFSRVRVFYGTDRGRGDSTPNQFYGAQRRDDGSDVLELGHCEVSIPYKHAPGEIERPSIWKFEFRETPARHVVLLDVQPLDRQRWLNDVRGEIDESAERAALVFVHGFNVDFASAARRTAQMKYDLNFPGAAIMYSWPAPANYVECEGNAIWTLPHLTEFLTECVHQTGAQKIHLIAHSMGTRVLTAALKELADAPAAAHIRYNQIVLAAPDIDAAVFKTQIAPRIVNAAERISIYSSSNDLALTASKKIHRYKRLGEGGADLTTFPEWRQIEVLDASAVDESLLGHSYYGNSPTILRDVNGVLAGLSAAARGLRANADHYLFQAKRNHLSDRAR